MPARLLVTAKYNEDPDALFKRASSFADMIQATRRIARYDHLPHVTMEQGKTYSTNITVLKLFSTEGYKIRIDRLCFKDRVMISHEGGKNIRSWRHKVDIEPANSGSVWTDVIEVDAGLLTPIVSRFAKFMYLHRHKHRGALSTQAELGATQEPAGKTRVEG